jgi:hypothetical protein
LTFIARSSYGGSLPRRGHELEVTTEWNEVAPLPVHDPNAFHGRCFDFDPADLVADMADPAVDEDKEGVVLLPNGREVELVDKIRLRRSLRRGHDLTRARSERIRHMLR